MRILLADTFPESRLAALRATGHVPESQPDLGAADLATALGGFDVLVVRSTVVDAETAGTAEDLRLIVRAGAGYNTIDLAACAAAGIIVSNVPGKNAAAVAELAIGLLLSVDRNIPDNVADLRAGTWNKSRYQRARGLLGRDIGVIGLGAIGVAFAERASGFGMPVHAVAKPRTAAISKRLDHIGTTYHPGIEALADAVDVLSFHVPSTPTTKGMIDADLLARLGPEGIVINTARGDLVDEEALLEALERGLRAGLDVYPDEPTAGSADYASALAQHPNVYGTHHIGASTRQAQEAIADEVIEIIQAFSSGETRNAVNLDLMTKADE